MATYRIQWKLIDGDAFEIDMHNYEEQSDAVDDWLAYVVVGIELDSMESIDVEEIKE